MWTYGALVLGLKIVILVAMQQNKIYAMTVVWDVACMQIKKFTNFNVQNRCNNNNYIQHTLHYTGSKIDV